ncbi:MAG TPA: pilus assembly protein N-terminal domain-containing protein, partial [Rhizomicrobium sp.]|nr:pilus assembly protein N-terminal domain-containing protein [Rhizomicrobium sp.]
MLRKGFWALIFTAIATLGVAPGVSAAAPGGARVISVSTSAGKSAHQRITLALNKAAIVQLDSDARDVLVSNPSIVDAVVRSPRRIFLLAQKTGQTNAFFFDGKGRQILSIDITVERDVTDLSTLIHNDMAGSNVKVSALNDNVVLSGTVNSQQDASRVQDLAARFAGDPKKVVNMLKVAAREQVMLKVRVAEVQRQIAKQFGIDLSSAALAAGVPIIAGTSNPFGLMGRALSDASGAQFGSVCPGAFLPNVASQVVQGATAAAGAAAAITGGLNGSTSLSGSASGAMHWVIDPKTGLPVYTQNLAGDLSPTPGTAANPNPTGSTNFNATASQNMSNGTSYNSTTTKSVPCSSPNNLQGVVKALEQVGLMHTLAEPNLTAVSGETAKFLAGGEFPVPASRDRDGNVTVQFKQFGVGLSFTPIVLSPNRISLQISTEVSELTNTGAYTLQGSTQTDPTTGQTTQVGGLTIPALS